MSTPFFTVVIPVYNVEGYLQQCVESVLNQTFHNFEIILVNDGSTDTSGIICREYASRDSRINLIEKKNEGLAEARNEGIRIAKGEYLLFLDSDDFWQDTDLLEDIFHILKKRNVDFLIFFYVYFHQKKNVLEDRLGSFEQMQFDVTSYDETMICLLKNNLLKVSAWSKVVRKDFLVKNKIMFIKGMSSEDIDWTFSIITNATSMDILWKKSYVYRMRESSLSHSIQYKNCIDLCYEIEKWSQVLEKNKTELNKKLLNFLSYEFFLTVGFTSYLNKNERKKIFTKLKELEWVTKYSDGKRQRLCKVMYFSIGKNMTSFLLAQKIRKK